MRILVATPLFPPEAGGPATYAKLIAEEFPKKGVEVEVIKFSDVRAYPKLIRHIAYAYRVFKAARTCDLILALDPVSVGLPAWVAAVVSKKPFYLRVAGDYAWEQGVQRFGVNESLDEFTVSHDHVFPVRLLRAIEKFVAKRAVRIIVPSKYLAHIVSSWGISPERISVVYNAPPFLSIEGLPPVPQNLPKKYLVVIARLVPWKGVSAVIRALGEIRKQEDIALVIVGDGPEKVSLEALAKNLHLTEAVLFTGSLPHEETLSILAHAKALVLNTGYEGLSHLILEAFALSVPVITTPVGGNPELVTDGVSGLFVPFNDVDALRSAVIPLLGDEEKCARVTSEAKKKLATLTREKTVEGSLVILMQV